MPRNYLCHLRTSVSGRRLYGPASQWAVLSRQLSAPEGFGHRNGRYLGMGKVVYGQSEFHEASRDDICLSSMDGLPYCHRTVASGVVRDWWGEAKSFSLPVKVSSAHFSLQPDQSAVEGDL